MADPGIPRGVINPWCFANLLFDKISQKLYGNEEILARRRPWRSLDPPMISYEEL